jgi:hypothetical protein
MGSKDFDLNAWQTFGGAAVDKYHTGQGDYQ